MIMSNLMAIVVAAAPALTAIIGIVAAVIKNKNIASEVIDEFAKVREEVANTKEYTEVKNQLKIVYQENIELKKKLNELLTKIDKIDRSKE